MHKIFVEVDFKLNVADESCENVVVAWMVENAGGVAADWKLRKVCEQTSTATASILFEGNHSAARFVSGSIASASKCDQIEYVDVKSFWHEDLFALLEDRHLNQLPLPASSMPNLLSRGSNSTIEQSPI